MRRAWFVSQRVGQRVSGGRRVDWQKNVLQKCERNAKNQWSAYNSAVLLDASGRRTYAYNKIHLVPFGEYVPLREWLTFAGRLTADISDFTPGVEYAVGRRRPALRHVHLLRGDFPQ